MGFQEFLSTAVSSPQLLITVLLTLGVIFVNGWTDAPNAIATCITTRCLKVRTAIIMSAVFNFLGVFIMTSINSSVASTISNMVDFGGNSENALIALCAALFSIVVYSTGASYLGIPTSWNKKKRMEAAQGLIRPTGKRSGDLDNLVKMIQDAGNGILWADDSIITDLVIKKRYTAECFFVILNK